MAIDDSDRVLVTAAKAALRSSARARRDALSVSSRDAATRAIGDRLVAHDLVATAHLVHCFIGIGSEVGTEELICGLLARGQRVIAPRVRGRTLEHIEIFDLETLVPGPLGLREPDPALGGTVDLAEVDVMLVPGLAFDGAGYRLGYGGAFYDGTLTALASHGRATTIGLAFEAQLVDEVPREEHDRPVDLIVTESRTIMTGA